MIELLPQDPECERLVLGSLMTDPQAITAAMQVLAKDDFWLEKHRKIFGAIEEIWRGGGVPDYVTVAQFLQSVRQLESVDGVGYLVDLESGMPHLVNLDGYLNRLRDLNTRRAILRRLHALAEQVNDPASNLESIASMIHDAHREAVESRNDDDGLMTLEEYVAQYPGGYEAFMKPDRGVKPIPTPWQGLTDILAGGWRPGELTVLAARPGYGKSAGAGQIAHTAALHGAYVRVFSLEMENREIWYRLFSGIGLVSLQKFRRGHCDSGEYMQIQSAIGKLSELTNLRISDRPHRTVNAIERILRKQKAKYPIGLVIIDYLQLMQMARRPRSRVEEVAEITRGLKLLCRELGCAFLVLAQLNRESVKENREPDLQDLRECGSIEQDADAVIFLYQKPSDKTLSIARKEPCPTKLIVRKQRNGPVGSVNCMFNARFVKLEECESEQV